MKKKLIIKIIEKIEPYYVILSNMFIGFFIMMTGVTILPILVKIVGKESYTPLYYSLSIVFGFMYFAYYKVFKILTMEEKELKEID